MAREFAKQFYNSKGWRSVREYVLKRDYYLCQKCEKPAAEVHHIIRLTAENINDFKISLNADNLISLCKDCHFAEHEQKKPQTSTIVNYSFDESGMIVPSKKVFIVTGCYGSGKSTYVKQNMKRGDLVIDMDMLFHALSMGETHDTPSELLRTVYETRDFLYSLVRKRKGDWKTAWIISALPDAQKRNQLIIDLNAQLISINTDIETCIKNVLQDETRKNKEEHLQYIKDYWDKFTYK